MKKKIVLILLQISLFIVSCSHEKDFIKDNKEIDNEEYVVADVSSVSGIFQIIPKNDEYINIYCNENEVSYKIGNKIFYKILSNDKELVSQYNLKLNFIKIKPFFIISYDDCPDSDYEIYKIHETIIPGKIIPAEIGINFNRRSLTDAHLKEMIAGGWEIVNHGLNHSRLEAVGITSDYEKGIDIIRGWFVHTFLANCEISIGDDVYTIVKNGTDKDGNYITITPPLVKNYNKGTLLQLSNKQIEKELFEGVDDFYYKFGYKIENFTYPYTVYDKRTLSLLKTKYKSARSYNGYNGSIKNLDNPGVNVFPFENALYLNSADYIINFTEDEINYVINQIVAKKAVGYQFSHTWDKNFDKYKLRYLIYACQANGIEIITRKQLFDYYELF